MTIVTKLLLVLSILIIINTQFCASICQSSDSISCLSSGPIGCTKCTTSFFNNSCTILNDGTSLVSYEATTAIPTNWTISSMNPGLDCIANFTHLVWNYTYNFYNKLVGGDYIYRNIAITAPHYEIKVRFSIAYIGVWWPGDHLLLNMADGIQLYDYNLTYTCKPGNTTDFLCKLGTTPNHIDCLQTYEYTFSHNTSNMLFNFSSISLQKDSTVQFWNLFDFLIVTVNCDPACAACFSNTSSSCSSCANGFYLVPNNTCASGCPWPLLLLPSPLNPNTGECISACPQGYYSSTAGTCLACPTGCLKCIDATLCDIENPSSSGRNLWKDYMAVWIVIILLGVFLIVSLVWRLCFYSKTARVDQLKLVPEEKTY